MRSPLYVFAAVVAALACAGASAQTSVYRWVDSQGKVHFSDTPPTEAAKDVTQKRVGSADPEESQLPYATQQAMKRSPVTLYTAPECGAPCDQGRTLLANRGIPYAERNVMASRADAEALKNMIGALQVPVLTVGQEKLRGYNESSWHAVLDTAGYLKTKVPGSTTPKPVMLPPTQPAPDTPTSTEPIK